MVGENLQMKILCKIRRSLKQQGIQGINQLQFSYGNAEASYREPELLKYHKWCLHGVNPLTFSP